jgi:hypothetical protein
MKFHGRDSFSETACILPINVLEDVESIFDSKRELIEKCLNQNAKA